MQQKTNTINHPAAARHPSKGGELLLCLGIESSCDETAAAIVDSDRNILSHVIYSSVPEHQKFGGVVPELAARAHILAIDAVVRRALDDAGKSISDIAVIAATAGPGLIGGVIVGWEFAVGLADAANKPLVAVNHLQGHALVPRLTNNVEFPFLLLLVSGGHSQILLARGVCDYEIIGQTIDDSAGEAFDKVAKMLNLGYPGGPEIDRRAAKGNPAAYNLPRPLCDKPNCDFSFSGIKTAVRTIVNNTTTPSACGVHPFAGEGDWVADICASFQAAVVDVIINRLGNAVKITKPKTLVVAGGVAKNTAIRGALEKFAAENEMEFAAPPLNLCTDNGAMIAWAGIENFAIGNIVSAPVSPRPRWPLTELK
ncbi:MAG: tRNA (adenosine(37)-N6)-threonylcarbamoyltransferase complex transferase subunit TsaD [Rickettsiales bacterium]|nr:tRNA (adenosine(37)-N6)-threonylcarbamoyltransferase complex transferase subunit TsaD [Rickettsiales bacterium]